MKKYLVTGATSGIGLGLTSALLDEGHSVIALGRDFTSIKSIGIDTNNLLNIEIDLSDIECIESTLEKVVNKEEKIDGFVHCAGIEETIPLRMYSPALVNKIFNINVFSAIEILRVVSQMKISNDSASLIFLSSVMGGVGQSGKVGYCASKSALYGVVKSAAMELSKRRIRVNAISPGLVNTPMMHKMFEVLPEDSKNELLKMHPLGFGTVEDVVSVICFLLSDKSKWITGQNFIIDGGYSIH